MIAILRFVGLTNAAVWFGAAVYFMCVAGPGFFTDEMKRLFPAPYLGRAAELAVHRHFLMHSVCGGIALAHLLVEWLYTGRPARKSAVWLVTGILAWTLLAGFVIAPHMHKLQTIKYSSMYGLRSTAAERDQAARQFGLWHGVTQTLGLLVTGGLFVYFWQTANAPGGTRFNSTTKFRS